MVSFDDLKIQADALRASIYQAAFSDAEAAETLATITDKSSGKSDRHFTGNVLAAARRYGLLRHLSKRTQHCRTRPHYDNRATGEKYHVVLQYHVPPEEVQKAAAASGQELFKRYSYRYLYHCASVIQCPTCAARILYKRSQEHKEIAKKMIESGYGYMLVTYTARHSHDTDIKGFIKGFLKAQKLLYQDRRWELFKTKYRIAHYISTRETTFDHPESDRKTGAHFHIHTVFFTEGGLVTKSDGDKIRRWLQHRWRQCLASQGMTAGGAGVHVGLPYARRKSAKEEKRTVETVEGAQAVAEYLAKAVSFELSGMTQKAGRRRSRISSYDLMWYCASEYKNYHKKTIVRRAYSTLDAYFDAMRGVSWRSTSQGLYAFCGMDELADEALLRGVAAEPVWVFDEDAADKRTSWRAVTMRRAQGSIICALEAHPRIRPESVLDPLVNENKDLWTGETVDGPLPPPDLAASDSEDVPPSPPTRYAAAAAHSSRRTDRKPPPLPPMAHHTAHTPRRE